MHRLSGTNSTEESGEQCTSKIDSTMYGTTVPLLLLLLVRGVAFRDGFHPPRVSSHEPLRFPRLIFSTRRMCSGRWTYHTRGSCVCLVAGFRPPPSSYFPGVLRSTVLVTAEQEDRRYVEVVYLITVCK